MGRFEDILWMEGGLDTSGGPAAIETCLNQYGGWTRTGADQITAKAINGLLLTRVMTADEVPLAAAASGDIACTPALPRGDISLPLSHPNGPGVHVYGAGVPIPSASVIDVLCNGSGAGAEEHAVVLRMWNPTKESAFNHGQPPATAERWLVEMIGDANTADTMDNPVDITGRSNAYTNGNTAVPNDENYTVWLHGMMRITLADQCGFFIVPPGDEHAYIYPSPALSNPWFDFEAEFGAPFVMTGSNPLRVGQLGTTNTASPFLLDISIQRPAGA